MEYYLGEILALAFPRVPYGTVQCNGTTMTIQQNSALFSLIGTYWGGDGRTTFGVPNLKGRSMIGLGTPTTISGVVVGTLNWSIGNLYGTDTYQLSLLQLPQHTHQAVFTPTTTTGGGNPAYVQVSSVQATKSDPNGNYLAKAWDPRPTTADNVYIDPPNAGTLGNLAGVGGGTGGITGGTVAIGTAGSSAAVTMNDPGAGVNFCLVTSGVYPSFE